MSCPKGGRGGGAGRPVLCSMCGAVKPRARNGRALCSICLKATQTADRSKSANRMKQYLPKWQTENPDRIRKYQDNLRAKPQSRARQLFNAAKGRARRLGLVFSLTVDWVLQMLLCGCAVTGLKFQFDRLPHSKCNPFAPSIDRIDNTLGYTQDNCRVVVWIFNLAKSQWSDQVVATFAKALTLKLAAAGDCTIETKPAALASEAAGSQVAQTNP